MLTTGITATTWVLTVLADTTVTSTDVTAGLSVLLEVSDLNREKRRKDKKCK
jgi:hypothetical protein